MASSFEKSVKGATKIKVSTHLDAPGPGNLVPARSGGSLGEDEDTDGNPNKAAPPKTKYIEHILVATHAGEAGVGEVFRALSNRLRDSTWTVVFKSLITIHLMIREGSPDATLSYLAKHRSMLATSSFADGMCPQVVMPQRDV